MFRNRHKNKHFHLLFASKFYVCQHILAIHSISSKPQVKPSRKLAQLRLTLCCHLKKAEPWVVKKVL